MAHAQNQELASGTINQTTEESEITSWRSHPELEELLEKRMIKTKSQWASKCPGQWKEWDYGFIGEVRVHRPSI